MLDEYQQNLLKQSEKQTEQELLSNSGQIQKCSQF